MESFVPLGGVSPTTYESKGLFSSVYPSMFHYEPCYDYGKYEHESVNINNHPASVDDKEYGNMPFWLRKASKVNLNDEEDATKVSLLIIPFIFLALVVNLNNLRCHFK